MNSYSKNDSPAFRKVLFRDITLLVCIGAITAIVTVLTLYAVAKGIID
jgi:hypothetical protein